MKLIDKDTLVAEIKKHQAIWDGMDDDYCKGQRLAYSDVISFLDTLEVKEIKEVDVENTAITEWDDYIKKIDGEPNYAYMLVKREDYISLAKHFYELGQISTRKED